MGWNIAYEPPGPETSDRRKGANAIRVVGWIREWSKTEGATEAISNDFRPPLMVAKESEILYIFICLYAIRNEHLISTMSNLAHMTRP